MPIRPVDHGVISASGAGAATGYVLIYGDPDNASADNAETYPYSFSLNGTSMTVGGRYHASTSTSKRHASGILDLSGGVTTPPASVTGQASFAWAFTGTTVQWSPYSEGPNNTFVDSSGNRYVTAAQYDASYHYYNVGVVKMDSSQSVDWNKAYKNFFNNNSGLGNAPGVLKTPTNGRVVTCYEQWRNTGSPASAKSAVQLLELNDSTGATTGSACSFMSRETYTTDQNTGTPVMSDPVGDKFAMCVGKWANGDTKVETMLLEATGSGLDRLYTVGSANLVNNTNTSINIQSCCIDSSDNVYIVGNFNAVSVDASVTPNNVFIAKWTLSGTTPSLAWRYCIRQGNDSISAGGIDLDGTDLYISGYSPRVGGSNASPFIAKIDVSGTPSLTWIRQAASDTYNCYSRSVKVVGSQVVSLGYGQTDPTGNVIGVMPVMNTDGTTLGTGVVDGIGWTVSDLSSVSGFIFSNAQSGNTANVDLSADSSQSQWDNGDNTNTGTVNAWIHDTPSAAGLGTMLVESGTIG